MVGSQRGRRTSRSAKTARGRSNLSIDEPRYLLGQVAYAAGISSGLLKAWITRKVIFLTEYDREAHGKGSSRVFTLRTALVVALAAELVKMGISIKLAGDLGGNAINMILEGAGGDVARINNLMAIYPLDALGVQYRAARRPDTIKDELVGEVAWDETIEQELVDEVPKDLGVQYRAARWDDTIKKVLVEDAPQDVSSVVIVSVRLVAERVLRHLGELE
jgi:hypothetical protein